MFFTVIRTAPHRLAGLCRFTIRCAGKAWIFLKGIALEVNNVLGVILRFFAFFFFGLSGVRLDRAASLSGKHSVVLVYYIYHSELR